MHALKDKLYALTLMLAQELAEDALAPVSVEGILCRLPQKQGLIGRLPSPASASSGEWRQQWRQRLWLSNSSRRHHWGHR